MRSFTQQEMIREMKKASTLEETHFVLETSEQRDSFRYEGGRLVEYECSVINSKPIKYKPEEIEGEAEFNWSTL